MSWMWLSVNSRQQEHVSACPSDGKLEGLIHRARREGRTTKGEMLDQLKSPTEAKRLSTGLMKQAR
jgi:hypothetical protein